ncbi:MAG: hypothetical protein M1826_000796 [Phylliscum demangeonii]|nr:MAG: hypothetical protein M1826_000796 [Phylliscum demangeonii]
MPETTTATAPATPAGPRSSSPSEPIRRSPSPDDSQPRRLHKTPAASRAVMTILASTVIPPRARRPAVRQPEARSSSAPSIKDARSPPTTAGKNRRRRRRLPEDARNEAGSGLLELDEKWLGAVSVHAEPIEALCDLLPTEILLPPLRMLPAEHADDGEKDVGRERETDEDGLFGHAGSESPDSFASSVATNASERRADDSSTPDTVSSLGLSSPSPPSFLPPPPLRTKQKHPRSLTSLLLPLSFFTTDERHPLHGRRLSGDGDDDDDDGEENDPRPLAELLHQMTLDPGGFIVIDSSKLCNREDSQHQKRPPTQTPPPPGSPARSPRK